MSTFYTKINKMLWNQIDEMSIEKYHQYFLDDIGFNYSLELRSLIQAVFDKNDYNSILAPTFHLGIGFSWITDDKVIVSFEDNDDLYDLSEIVWENKKIDLYNADYASSRLCGKFDLIVYVSPFGFKKQEHGTNIEEIYLYKSLRLLKENGILIVTIADNFLTAPKWQDPRKRILEDFSLEMIITHKNRISRSPIPCSTLIIKNNNQRDMIYLAEHTGNLDEILSNYLYGKGHFWVSKDELSLRWDRKFLDPKYESLRSEYFNKDTIKLQDIAEVIRGLFIKSEDRKEAGEYLVISPRLITDDHLIITDDNLHKHYCSVDIFKSEIGKRAIIRENDIVISLVGDFKWYRHVTSNEKIVPNQNMAIIRTKAEYSQQLEQFFQSETGRSYLKSQADMHSRGGTHSALSIADLKNFVIPSTDSLKSASEYKKIDKLEYRIAEAFKAEGWEVKFEYRYKNYCIDLALFHKGILKGVVEIKNVSSSNVTHRNNAINQLMVYRKSIGVDNVFLFMDNELYLLKERELMQLPEIPSPNFDVLRYLSNIEADDIIEGGISLKSLPQNAVSLGNQYTIETVLLEAIIKRLDRLEGKIDDILDIVKNISQQIKDYQSLITKQIDRATSEDEIERIIQSFADECSEKIVQDMSKNISERDYNLEELKLKHLFEEDSWNKLDESSKTFLTSSKLMYNNLLLLDDVVDYSGVCLLVTKALEVEVSKRFYLKFMSYLEEKYPGKQNNHQFPTALINQYGKKIRFKDFTLGKVKYILCPSYSTTNTQEQINNNKAKLAEFAKEELFLKSFGYKEIENKLNYYAEKIEEVRENYRNPSAHTDEIKRIDAENCFKLVTDVERILKVMLDSFVF